MTTETVPGTGTITILSPVSVVRPTERPMAPRPAKLDGVTIALIDNAKHNFDQFLDEVERRLSERYQFAGVVRKRKPTATQPADFLGDLAEQCQVAVNGLGD